MLAYYPWYVDEQQVVPKARLNATLAQLADACPADQRETAARLRLKALTTAAADKGTKPRDDPKAAATLTTLLADPRVARANVDLIVYYSDNAVRAYTLPHSPQRAQLVSTLDASLQRLVADATLSHADRLAALDARISLARIDDPKAALDPALLKSVREQVARVDRRPPTCARALMVSAAFFRRRTARRTDALLKAELSRRNRRTITCSGSRPTPRRAATRPALDWYQKVHRRRRSGDAPAVGASYVAALVDCRRRTPPASIPR
jgi:hypothetical protein